MGETGRKPMERPRKGKTIMGGGGEVIDDKGENTETDTSIAALSVGMFYVVGQYVAPKHRFFFFPFITKACVDRASLHLRPPSVASQNK